MKGKISKVLLSLFFFVSIANICSAQNTARGIAAEKIAVEQKDNSFECEPRLCFSTGHSTGGINFLTYSPNGKYIATAGNDKRIIIWDSSSGKEIKKLNGHTDSVYSVSYSPDGKFLASGSMDGTIRIWNIETGKEIQKFWTKHGVVLFVQYICNGKYVVSKYFYENYVSIWNIRTGTEYKLEHDCETIETIAVSADEKYMSTVDNNHILRIWNIEQRVVLKRIQLKDLIIRGAGFSHSGEKIAIACAEGFLQVYDLKNWKKIEEYNFSDKSDNDDYCKVTYSPDDRYLILGDGYRDGVFLDLKTKEYYSGTANISFSFDNNFRCMYANNFYGGAGFYVIDNNTEWLKFNVSFCNSVVTSIKVSPKGDSFAVASYFFITLWDLKNGKKIKDLNYGFVNDLEVLAYSPNGKFLTIRYDDYLQEIDIESGKILWSEKIEEIYSLTYTKDSKFIVLGTQNGIYTFNSLSGEKVKKVDRSVDYFYEKIALSLSEKFLICIFRKSDKDSECQLEILNFETGKEVSLDNKSCTNIINYDFNNKYILSSREYGSGPSATCDIVSISDNFEITKRSVKFESSPKDDYYRRQNNIMSVAATTDGKYFIGGTENGSIEVWNIETGNLVYTKKGEYTSFVNSIDITSDDEFFISGGFDGIIKVWDTKTGSLIYTIANGMNGEYLTYTPEGFFTGTEWAMKNLVHIVDGMDVIGIDQVYDKLYRPDLVAAKMRGEDISEYAKEVNLASIVRSGNAPAVAIENLPELSDSRDVTFDICVQNTGGGIGNVSIVLNGKTIRLSEGVESSNGEQKIFRHTVTLQNGQNKIEAFAMNSAGMIESPRASADVSWQGKTSKPNLYVLTVAVNKYRDKDLWLNYCVPDADSIEESFKKQQSGLYQNVCVYSLKDAEVTKEGLEQKFKELSSIVTADDVFVFFVSGHGTAYDDGDYYFIPVNFRYTNKTDIPLKAISKSDLTKNLSLIKAGKSLMMLDTCNSGAFFADSNKRGMGDKGIFERLSRATGHAILAAASDSQSAMEGYNGHGVFTYVLLNGLAGKADSDGDGFVTLSELSSYVENQVPELSYEKWGYEQVPQKELRRQDFPIAEKLSD